MLMQIKFEINPLNELPEKNGNYWIFEVDGNDRIVDISEVTFRDGKWNMMDDVMANPKAYNDFYWAEKVEMK